MSSGGKQVELEIIMLSEISQILSERQVSLFLSCVECRSREKKKNTWAKEEQFVVGQNSWEVDI
jgi:hypothetical protein